MLPWGLIQIQRGVTHPVVSFAGNWLEELIAEWLELDRFLVQVTPPVQIRARGGRRAPDVVGGRIYQGTLQIRHCEAASWPAQNPNQLAQSYSGKFAQPIQQAVSDSFARLFGLPQGSAHT